MESQNELLKKFSRYIYPYIKEEIILFILMILSSIGTLVMPYMLKIIIDDIFPKGNYSDLLTILTILVGIFILQIVFSLISDAMSITVSKKISSDIREDTFISILNKEISFFKETKVGEIVFTLMNDVDNIQQSISSLLIRSIKNIIILIGVIVMLFVLDYKLALVSLIFIPITIFVLKKFMPYIKNNFAEIQKMEASLNNYLVERINNIRVIKSYGTLDYEKSNIKFQHEKIVEKYLKGTFIIGLNTSLSAFIMSLASISVLSFGGYLVFQHTMSVGALIAFVQYLNRLFAPTVEIVNASNQFSKSIISMRRVSAHFSDERCLSKKNVSIERKTIERIVFKNIFLSHGDINILNNINITFDQGKTYVLSGNSGSGKSSFLSLLCEFITPTSGSIIINNEIMKDCLYWKNEYCLIEKENQLFHDSLKNNITYGGTNKYFEIDEIIKFAHLEEVIKKLDNGIDTKISFAGGTLSDGQKQRISIARSINKSPSVFIFDESTASLDSNLEFKIIKSLRITFPNAIIIIVSHRLESLRIADYSYVFRNGKIEKQDIVSIAI